MDTQVGPTPDDKTIERTLNSASATPTGAWSAAVSLGDLSGLGGLSLTVDGREPRRPCGARTAGRSCSPAGRRWRMDAPLELETRTDVSTYRASVAADPAGNVVALGRPSPSSVTTG